MKVLEAEIVDLKAQMKALQADLDASNAQADTTRRDMEWQHTAAVNDLKEQHLNEVMAKVRAFVPARIAEPILVTMLPVCAE